MKRTLLTGGLGFVGANLARRLLREGHEVHLLVRREHNPWRIAGIRSDVQLHVVDFGDANEVAEVVGRVRPEWVFHLAAHGAYSWQTDLHRMVQTNIVGTINLVEACCRTGFEAFVNTGSSSEYGFKDHAATEQDCLEPNSHYAVTKASATLYCALAARRTGLRLVTLRLYSVYGPYEAPQRLIPTLVVHGLTGRLPPLVNPDVARDFVYADDVTEAYLLAASRPHQELDAVYNVGTGVQTTLRDVVTVGRRIMHVTAEPEWGTLPNRQWDTSVWVADSRKIQARLGWEASHDFEHGLLEMVRWMRETPGVLAFYQKPP